MKIKTLDLKPLVRFIFYPFLFATLLLVGCGDDPEPINEEELITTLNITLTPVGGGTSVTMTFKDLDGIGSNPPEYIYEPASGNSALLEAGKIYNATIELLDETSSPAEDITEEVREEDDEHLFCFSVENGANLNIDYADEDDDGLPVGIVSTWETGASSEGTVTIILRHQPGTKNGTCPGSGDTDIEVTFSISIQ
jgi:hypothetical protein